MNIIRPRPAVLALGALFIAYHLAATVTTNAPRVVRDPLWPLFETYADGLRMTGKFGVFARYTAHTSVAVYGVTEDGRRLLLAHTSPTRPSPADARVVKLQRKFVHEDMRERFGRAYLSYFCRVARQQPGVVRVELELEREGGRSELALSRECRSAHD